MRTSLPHIAVTISFIDAINHGDLERITSLLADDHRLLVFDEPEVIGKPANVAAWHQYVVAYPDYVVHPRQIVEHPAGEVVVLGHTSGSHLELIVADERDITVIWRAVVRGDLLTLWQIIEDTPAARDHLGFAP